MSKAKPTKTAASKARSQAKKYLKIERVFSTPKVSPFDEVEWDYRTAEINDDSGKVFFRQENVEVPKFWSELATKVVVSKYFYGETCAAKIMNNNWVINKTVKEESSFK